MKKIAVLTSGGDAPGMNAAIRSVVRYGIFLGMKVFGVERGYAGLINNEINEMSMRSVSDILQRGGTKLFTARCEEFKTDEGVNKAIKNMRELGIEGLVVIGGDGSFMGAHALSVKGMPTVGIPGTIDNDLAYTEFSIGFDTACNTALDAINKIRDTINSHERINVIEVMGRHCGDLALYAGICGGAEVIIVPEIPLNIGAVCEKLVKNKAAGKKSGIVLLAEGAGKAEDIAREIAAHSGLSVRSTVLGHIQRGGSPTMADRLLATNLGVHAVKLLDKGQGNRVVGIRQNQIFDMDIIEAVKLKKQLNKGLYETAAIISR